MDAIRARLKAFCRASYACLIKGSPPEPCDDVLDLFDALHIPRRQQLMMYSVFHELKQGEVDEIIETAMKVKRESIYLLVEQRRRWVSDLLKTLLFIGGAEDDEVTWDQFLYILLQFCSLSKEELCQCLFLIILRKMDSKVSHYVTMQQLIDFYSFWAKCPVTSFNTRAIDFTRLPQRRYYVEDFTELVQRFVVLLNPIIHLQRSLHEFLPSEEFWNYHHRSEVIIRKITADFFKMEKTRCFLFGEPPFRESCEVLAPEALGFEACNKEQWNLRTFDLHERIGAISDANSFSKDGKWSAPPGFQYRSLKQFSVWGEQPSPEETERMMMMDQEDVYLGASGYISKHVKSMDVAEDAQDHKDRDPTKKNEVRKVKKGLAMHGEELKPLTDPSTAALRAAALDETFNPPPADMPPKWMKVATTFPAPRNANPDPPLRSMRDSSTAGTQSAFWNSKASFGITGMNQTMDSWGEEQPGQGYRKSATEGKLARGGKNFMRGFNEVKFDE